LLCWAAWDSPVSDEEKGYNECTGTRGGSESITPAMRNGSLVRASMPESAGQVPLLAHRRRC
jgi:hypothetical protein